jgi:hypothetical protein
MEPLFSSLFLPLDQLNRQKKLSGIKNFQDLAAFEKAFFTFLCYYGNFAHLSAFYHSAIWLHCQFQALGKMTRLHTSPHNSM